MQTLVKRGRDVRNQLGQPMTELYIYAPNYRHQQAAGGTLDRSEEFELYPTDAVETHLAMLVEKFGWKRL